MTRARLKELRELSLCPHYGRVRAPAICGELLDEVERLRARIAELEAIDYQDANLLRQNSILECRCTNLERRISELEKENAALEHRAEWQRARAKEAERRVAELKKENQVLGDEP